MAGYHDFHMFQSGIIPSCDLSKLAEPWVVTGWQALKSHVSKGHLPHRGGSSWSRCNPLGASHPDASGQSRKLVRTAAGQAGRASPNPERGLFQGRKDLCPSMLGRVWCSQPTARLLDPYGGFRLSCCCYQSVQSAREVLRSSLERRSPGLELSRCVLPGLKAESGQALSCLSSHRHSSHW